MSSFYFWITITNVYIAALSVIWHRPWSAIIGAVVSFSMALWRMRDS